MPRSATTREDLLRATRELLESVPFAKVTLGNVAKRAKVSRQAVYLHFKSKPALLLALVEWIDATGRLPKMLGRAAALRDPVQRLLTMVEGAATYTGDIATVAIALRAAKETDDAARAAYDDRMRRRLETMRRGVQAVADAGRLAPGLTVRAAADVLFALNNIAVYEDLVRERGWSQRRYATFLRDSVRRLLVVG